MKRKKLISEVGHPKEVNPLGGAHRDSFYVASVGGNTHNRLKELFLGLFTWVCQILKTIVGAGDNIQCFVIFFKY